MNIAFFEVASWEIPILKEKLGGHTLYFSPTHLSAKNVAGVADSDILSTRIYSPLTAEILSQLPQLKLVATRTTGFDHIDLDFCRNHEITVANVPTYGIKA